MFNEPRKILFRSFGTIIFIGIIIFAFFKYGRYIQGPEITQINMESFMSIDEPSIITHAEIKNTKSVNINGREIILKNRATFDEIFVFSPGNNIIEIMITDTFGKTKLYTYNIYYNSKGTTDTKTLEQAMAELNESEPEDELSQEEN